MARLEGRRLNMASHKRKPREYEKTCDCGAYGFPHRMLGGRCEGIATVALAFDDNDYGTSGDCKDCAFSDKSDFTCQVLEGLEEPKHAPCLQDFIRYEGIRPPLEWSRNISFFKGARA
jgi:hypothetical protein